VAFGPREIRGKTRLIHLTFCRGDDPLRRFENTGVVGAGMMGSEIALMFALPGHPTKLSDQKRVWAPLVSLRQGRQANLTFARASEKAVKSGRGVD
jgi:3-hydroxyacyl-CoA dehydrogenase